MTTPAQSTCRSSSCPCCASRCFWPSPFSPSSLLLFVRVWTLNSRNARRIHLLAATLCAPCCIDTIIHLQYPFARKQEDGHVFTTRVGRRSSLGRDFGRRCWRVAAAY